MYGIFRFDDRVTQITLPAPPGVSRPWGFPPNVYVLHGVAPALIGTGLPGTADALRAALEELGLAPERVHRVLLPSSKPESIGNVELFPRAALLAHPAARRPRDAQSALRRRIERIARALNERGSHPGWEEAEVDAFLAAYFEPMPEHLDVVALRDAQRVQLGGLRLEVVETPGVDDASLALYEPTRRWLFSGATIGIVEEPIVNEAVSFMESLRAISQLEPEAVFPMHGGIERDHRAVFRTVGLATNNLLTNMPFAVSKPSSLPEICHRDLGYYPRDLLRFTGLILRWEAMLEELVRTGVAQRDSDDVWSCYRMDRPSRLA